jgi:triosephosphate isomerase
VEEVEHLTITGNNILNGTNNGSGAFTGIISSAAVATANINNNIIRSHSRTFAGAGALLLFQALVLLQRN